MTDVAANPPNWNSKTAGDFSVKFVVSAITLSKINAVNKTEKGMMMPNKRGLYFLSAVEIIVVSKYLHPWMFSDPRYK